MPDDTENSSKKEEKPTQKDDTENSSKKEEKPTQKIDILQNYFNFGRNIFISGFLGFLGIAIVFYPEKINEWRQDAGIHQIGVGGNTATFDDAKDLLNNASTLHDANSIISALQSKIQNSNIFLNSFKQDEKLGSKQQQQLAEQIQKNKDITSAAQSVQKSINQNLANSANIIEKSQIIVDQTLRNWGIISGADISIDTAKPEAKKAQNKGFSNVNIYKRNNYFRTVIEFNSQNSANQNLAKAKQLNPGAYVVNLDLWCPNSKKVKVQDLDSGISVYECP